MHLLQQVKDDGSLSARAMVVAHLSKIARPVVLQKFVLNRKERAVVRHSAATLLLSLGVHPKVVQELPGHTQISITMDVYSHVLPGMQQDAMKRLNDALKGQKDDKKEESS